jgi:hypothetical protein
MAPQSDRTMHAGARVPVLRPARTDVPLTTTGTILLMALIGALTTGVLVFGATGAASEPARSNDVARGAGIAAFVAAAAFIVARFGYDLPGISRLYVNPVPSASLADGGLRLDIPSVGTLILPWSDIGDLIWIPRRGYVLRSTTGEELCVVPPALAKRRAGALIRMMMLAQPDQFEPVTYPRRSAGPTLLMKRRTVGSPDRT